LKRELEKVLNHRILGREASEFIVFALIIIYAVLFSYYTILKHSAYRTYAWDLGIFSQALWTTLNEGRFFYHTLELFISESGSFFAVHFSPVLFSVIPFYAICPKPETLLVLQSSVLALGAYPLYLLVKEEFDKNAVIALVFVVAYLLYPPLQGVNWFDFHVQSFFPLFVLSALYFFKKKNWKGYCAFVFLSLMVEEQVAILLIFWGIYVVWISRKEFWQALKLRSLKNSDFLIPILTITVSLVWFAVTRWTKMMLFPINPAFSNEYKALASWRILGIQDDPLYMPVHIILNPYKVVEALSFDFPLKFLYLVFLFAPLIFLPLRTSAITVSFAWIVPALLSNNSFYYRLGYQYPAYIIPFIFYASIQGLKKVSKGEVKMAISLSKMILIVTPLLAVSLSPIFPFPKFFDPAYLPPTMTSHEEHLNEVLKLIPYNASVLTQNNIFPHLSSRSNVYAVYPHSAWEQTKKKIFDFTTNVTHNVEYILVDLSADFVAFEYALERAGSGGYGVYASVDKIVLFKLNYTSRPIIFEPLSEIHGFSTLKLSNGALVEDSGSVSGSVLFHSAVDSTTSFFWFGPYTPLPPGNYTAILRLKIGGSNQSDLLTVDVAASGGKKTLTYRTVGFKDFSLSGVWQNITVDFELEQPMADIEVRGVALSNVTDIYLDYIMIQQRN
jgi:uncharacterized membrane protein